MPVSSVLRSAAVGLVTALVVGLAVTELAAQRIAFSLLVGIPAGVVAGLAAAAIVHLRLANPTPARRRVALAFGNAGLAFLVVLVAGTVVLDAGVTVALATAAVFGLATGAASWVRSADT